MSKESASKLKRMTDAAVIGLLGRIQLNSDSNCNKLEISLNDILCALSDLSDLDDSLDPSTYKLLILGITTKINSMISDIKSAKELINADIRKLKVDRGY